MGSFEVIVRDEGAIDIYAERARQFTIRGKPGEYRVYSYLENRGVAEFKTLTNAMNFIVEHYLYD